MKSASSSVATDKRALSELLAGRDYLAIEALARRVLLRSPGDPLGRKALSHSLLGQYRFKEALALLKPLANKYPGDGEIQNNLGIAAAALLELDLANEAFRRATMLLPNDPEVIYNLGAALVHQRDWVGAIPHLLKAIDLYPDDYLQAAELLAACLLNLNRLDEAETCFRELWQVAPENSLALTQLVFIALRASSWQTLGDELAILIERVMEQTVRATESAGTNVNFGPPFPTLAMPGVTRAMQRAVAWLHAQTSVGRAVYAEGQRWRAERAPLAGRKLRVGYFSADFRYHPVGFAIPTVIEQHDRAEFEVFGYSTGINDGSAIRARLMHAFDHFVDLREASILEVVKRIRADAIDVLVDLQGWTTDCRPDVLALRVAPVQINWLGYPGTIGDARLADHLIADAWVIPPSHQPDYAERVEYVRGCYLPFDTTRCVGVRPVRSSHGLPEDSFVFCSLNNNYKLNPAVFDVWAQILQSVPNSVLWLSNVAGGGAERLRAQMVARGVVGERIVFAQRVEDSSDHLARLQLADLALDPFPYNSHSSGSEVMWAGVPMVTLIGDTFASRVGASLLADAGLPEMIVGSTTDYAALAIALAGDRGRLTAMRDRLALNRKRVQLQSRLDLVSDLEAIYQRTFSSWVAAGSDRR